GFERGRRALRPPATGYPRRARQARAGSTAAPVQPRARPLHQREHQGAVGAAGGDQPAGAGACRRRDGRRAGPSPGGARRGAHRPRAQRRRLRPDQPANGRAAGGVGAEIGAAPRTVTGRVGRPLSGARRRRHPALRPGAV
ncbi:MAG: hypothetical protein AVDCRST_MAG59-2584, partial [uncultured Thermomicrobiales bacterium]